MKKTTVKIIASVMLATTVFTLLASSSSASAQVFRGASYLENRKMKTAKFATVVDAAVATPALSTLVTAVTTAGLVEALQAGNLTVFAPTNDAFGNLPAGTVETLLKPENKETLTKILTYHVVAGRIDINKYKDGDTLTTLQGQKLTVRRDHIGAWLTTSTGQCIRILSSLNKKIGNANAYTINTVMLPQ
jgi:uncharacterized surface protein with fasciclin (FAS1) repeats